MDTSIIPVNQSIRPEQFENQPQEGTPEQLEEDDTTSEEATDSDESLEEEEEQQRQADINQEAEQQYRQQQEALLELEQRAYQEEVRIQLEIAYRQDEEQAAAEAAGPEGPDAGDHHHPEEDIIDPLDLEEGIEEMATIEALTRKTLLEQIKPFNGSTDVNEWIEAWTRTMQEVEANNIQQLHFLQAKLQDPALTWYRRRPENAPNGEPWTIETALESIRLQYELPNARRQAKAELARTTQNGRSVDAYAHAIQQAIHKYNPHMPEAEQVDNFYDGLDSDMATHIIAVQRPETLQAAIALTRTYEAELKNIQEKRKKERQQGTNTSTTTRVVTTNNNRQHLGRRPRQTDYTQTNQIICT